MDMKKRISMELGDRDPSEVMRPQYLDLNVFINREYSVKGAPS